VNKPIRILIADNNREFSAQLKTYLNRQDGLKVVFIARDGQGVVELCKEILPDLVVIDLHLPVLDSVHTIKSITAQNDHIKILGISDVPNDRYAVEAVKAGASGYIKKDGSNGNGSYKEIAGAIRQVFAGEVVLDSSLASDILKEFL